jgi:hypothetical protein
MSLNLDIVMDTDDYSVDMKTGLETLQGVSDATRCIAETILTESAPPKRQHHKGNVRTTLKQTFKGSYGHVFSIDIFDKNLKNKFNSIGKLTFSELISYFISEALYQEPSDLSTKAQKIIDKLGGNAEKLVQQLRVSSLENIHELSQKFDQNIKIRYRKSRNEQTVLAKFDRTTAKVLQAKESDEKYDITASITRLNIHTGNGRLQLKEANQTIAFGFGIEYREVTLNAKKLFSENLNHNNGLISDKWKFVKITVKPIKLRDGKIVKYIVKGFYEDK